MLLPAVACTLLLSGSTAPWMTGQSRAEDLEVWLVTFGPGEEVPEWWGHTGLAVQDNALHQARLYNYGMFAFDDGFLGRFVRGRLEFWAGEDPVGPTFQLYQSLDRDVRIQVLNLTPAQAMSMAQALATNVLPENRMYLYDHYRDNCSTRPRDILDRALGGQLLAATRGPARYSLRQLTRKYSRVNPLMLLVLDLLQNDLLDKPIQQAQEAFLPDELERQVQALQITREDGSRVPAVKRQFNWYTAKRPSTLEEPPRWTPLLLLAGLVLGAAAVLCGAWARGGGRLPRVLLGLEASAATLVLGVLGTVMALLWFTDHAVGPRNQNLFFVNPLTLAAFPCAVMSTLGSKRGARALRAILAVLAVTSLLGIAVKVLPAFDQDNWNVMALLVPWNLGLAFGVVWSRRAV